MSRRLDGRPSARWLCLATVVVLATATACGGSSHPSGAHRPRPCRRAIGRLVSVHALHARTWHPDARPLPSSREHGLERSDLPTMTPATQPALRACNHFIAQINAEKTAGAARAAASDLPALILYARCMRAHADRDARPGPDRRARSWASCGISPTCGRHCAPQFRRGADSACRHLSRRRACTTTAPAHDAPSHAARSDTGRTGRRCARARGRAAMGTLRRRRRRRRRAGSRRRSCAGRRSWMPSSSVARSPTDSCHPLIGGPAGTVTAMPDAGATIRPGHVLYRVDDRPVLLLHGTTPAWRALEPMGAGRPRYRRAQPRPRRAGLRAGARRGFEPCVRQPYRASGRAAPARPWRGGDWNPAAREHRVPSHARAGLGARLVPLGGEVSPGSRRTR